MPLPSTQQEATASGRATPVPAFDLTRQYETIKDEVQAATERVLSTQYFIGGPELQAFEAEAAQYLGVAAAIGCASGTDALWLALQASGVQPGDSVLTTPFSFFASASSITRCGAKPIFADVDPATLNLAPEATRIMLRQQPAGQVRAILPVHLFGQCADVDALGKVAGEFGAALVEDAAQAFGAKWNGQPAGTLGKAAAFSFYPTKNLGAYGDGGCVTTDDPDVASHVRRLRSHGSERRYYHEEIGWNSRLDAMQAAVLRIKLRHLDKWNEQRRVRAERYNALLQAAGLVSAGAVGVTKEAPIALLQTRPEAFHISHQYVVRSLRRDELRTYLNEQRIGTEVYYPVPLHLQQAFAYLGYGKGAFPESERASAEVIALPMFPELRDDEQQRVIAAVAKFYS